MYYAKSRTLMGGSLAVVAMLLLVWALTSVLHARVGSSTFDVSGGTILNTCKEPCQDYHITSMTECRDPGGGNPCDTTKCSVNGLRYLLCVCDGDAEPDADDCDFVTASYDWWRSEYQRHMSCSSSLEYERYYTGALNHC